MLYYDVMENHSDFIETPFFKRPPKNDPQNRRNSLSNQSNRHVYIVVSQQEKAIRQEDNGPNADKNSVIVI